MTFDAKHSVNICAIIIEGGDSVKDEHLRPSKGITKKPRKDEFFLRSNN